MRVTDDYKFDYVHQPSYDFDFARLCKWLKENGLIMVTDIKGRSQFYKKG